MKDKAIALLNQIAKDSCDKYDRIAYETNKTDMAFGGWCLFSKMKRMTRPEMLGGLRAALMSCETVQDAINAAADHIVASMPN